MCFVICRDYPSHLKFTWWYFEYYSNGLYYSLSQQGKPYPIFESDLGFETGDYVLNNAGKALRLMYIHDLRELQTKINECIVAVQTITANPKTDTKLGKVGR